MASTSLSRVFGTSTDEKKWTLSVWIKHSGTNGQEHIMFSNAGGNDNTGWFQIQISGNQLNLNGYSTTWLTSTQYLRDVSGWYHLVVTADSTAAAANRLKAYINGQEITSWSTNNVGGSTSSNQTWGINMSGTNYIGAEGSGGANAFNGSMSHLNFIDGTVYSPSLFGETDSTTGEWKIKADITGVNYGNNGSSILKNSNSLTDVSGKSNNWSLANGTLTDTKDCPDNVFSTMNILANFGTQWALFENGNTYVRSAGTGEAFIASTLGIPPTSGKFYTEVKYTQGGSASNIGISGRMNPTAAGDYVGNKADSYAYRQNGEKKSDDVSSSYGDSYAPGDIIGIAVDATNSKIYFSKNGVWQNSGNPESGATGTGAAFTISTTPTDGFYFMACAKESGSDKNYYAWNFGNGFFQTSAVADNSTATASTPGVFNYAVPTGYQPLSTKGLNA